MSELPIPEKIHLAAEMLAAKMAHYLGDPDADPHLRRVEPFAGKLIAAFRQGPLRGHPLPWPKTADKFRIRPGEVTIAVAINGSGKTTLVSQIVLHQVSLGVRVVMVSLEMSTTSTLAKMARQAAGSASPSDDFLVGFVDWLGERKFLVYDQHGRANWRFLVKVIRYAAIELGVKVVVLDNLAMMTEGEDDYNDQKNFLTELCAVARDTGVHVLLVHHIRKLRDESEIPNKFDVKGTGSITDQADNVLVLWRNRKKEIERANAERDGIEFDNGAAPDALLIVDKQRHHEWEGRIRLWFDAPSMSYRERAERPMFAGYDIPIHRAVREPGADEIEVHA